MVDAAERLARFFEANLEPDLVSAYLFGSHARGQAHRDSDVDVAVLLDRSHLPSDEARFDLRVRLAADLPSLFANRSVDVIVLNDAPPLFGRKILHEGVRVFCSDLEKDHEFVRDTQILAADIEPWLQRVWARKLEALAR